MVTLGEFGNNGVEEDEETTFSASNIIARGEETHDVESINSVSKQNINEKENQSKPLRRSERQTTQPKYLDDYILLAEELGEEVLFFLNNEPRNFGEAKNLKQWTRACEEEIESIVKNKTWDLVDLPYGAKPTDLKGVFKIKRNSDGTINKFKARLVAKRYVQQHGIDFDEVFAPLHGLRPYGC